MLETTVNVPPEPITDWARYIRPEGDLARRRESIRTSIPTGLANVDAIDAQQSQLESRGGADSQ